MPRVIMTLLMMATVFVFALWKGWGSDTPFSLRRLGGASLEVVVVILFPVVVYDLVTAGLSINLAVGIGLVLLISG